MRTSEVTYALVCHANASHYRDDFVAIYAEAFSDPPYFEKYEPENIIRNVWEPHCEHGLIVMACMGDAAIGLGCAIPVPQLEDGDRAFLSRKYAAGLLPINPDSMWYMSELGVKRAYRHRGIGSRLIEERLRLVLKTGSLWYIMRTAAEGSNSKGLYERAGAVQIPGVQDLSTSVAVTETMSQSPGRVWLYGNCNVGCAQSLVHRA